MPSAAAGPRRELPAEEEGARTPEPLTLPDVWGEVSGRLDRDAVTARARDAPDAQREALELAYFGGPDAGGDRGADSACRWAR